MLYSSSSSNKQLWVTSVTSVTPNQPSLARIVCVCVCERVFLSRGSSRTGVQVGHVYHLQAIWLNPRAATSCRCNKSLQPQLGCRCAGFAVKTLKLMRHCRDEGEGAARPFLPPTSRGRRRLPREHRTRAKDDNFSRAGVF